MSRLFADLIAIGRVVKPQGRRGEVLTQPLSDRPDRFPSLKRAFVPGPQGVAREVRVTSCWPHKGRFVLKLEGVDTIDAAEEYRGQELRIGDEELAVLPDGSYYHHQLKGLQARSPEGRRLGVVRDLLETGSATVLVIDDGGRERLVPLADEFVKQVSLREGSLTVDLHDSVVPLAN